MRISGVVAGRITAEGVAEAKAFSEYSAWCNDAATILCNKIENGTSADFGIASVKLEGQVRSHSWSQILAQTTEGKSCIYSPAFQQ